MTTFQQCFADCLVDLLIRAVEELAQSEEIKVRRHLTESSYRVRQTTICHREAVKLFQAHPEKVMQPNKEEWRVDTRGKKCLLSTCGVCPYAFSCSCTDNRAGISCSHVMR
nr:unnamed protein product [Haemonchus contortus]